MTRPDVIDALIVANTPDAPANERDQAAREFGQWHSKQAVTTMEVLEHLSPQDEKSRLPIQIGRKYFHSWKDTERLFAEVTSWRHFHPLDVCSGDTAPPASQAAFEDVFADLIRERGAILKLHPLYKRWTIFVKEPTEKEGMQYLAAIMVCEPGVFGQIPLDLELNVDTRLHPIIRNLGIGDYKVPTRADFEHLRYALADRRMHGGTAQKRAEHFALEEQKSLDEGHREMYDFVDDFMEHNGALYARDVNRKYGSMQGLPFVPQTSLEQFDKEVPAYEMIPALDENGKHLGYSYRRKRKSWEILRSLDEAGKRELAINAVQARWQEMWDATTVEDRKILYLGEPMIDDEERQRRIMELAKELGLNRWERKKIEKATEENLTKQFADSASMLEDILQAMSAEMRADEDKKGETEWQSAESPQQRSQN
jgi:hypothetical protein